MPHFVIWAKGLVADKESSIIIYNFTLRTLKYDKFTNV